MGTTGVFILVWGILLALLAATVGASFVLTGAASLVTTLVIAGVQATLVFWFFMHLREETGLVRIFAVGASLWLIIMFLMLASDYLTRPVTL